VVVAVAMVALVVVALLGVVDPSSKPLLLNDPSVSIVVGRFGSNLHIVKDVAIYTIGLGEYPSLIGWQVCVKTVSCTRSSARVELIR